MEGNDSLSSLALKAQSLAAEKQRREEMLVVRKTFKEPQIERDRLPTWAILLQKKKEAQMEFESSEVGHSRWFSCLERQQWALGRNSETTNSFSTTASMTGTVRSKDRPTAHGYMSSWLRQLHSEVAEATNA